jgi:hypothetical protein
LSEEVHCKTSQVIAMLKREGGATLEEIMTTMQWQQHTTRSMLSAGGPLVKKYGPVVTSEKVGDKREPKPVSPRRRIQPRRLFSFLGADAFLVRAPD